METTGRILSAIIQVAVLVIIARIIIDWIIVLARNWRPSGLVAVLCESIFSLTDPPLRAIRRAIPPLRLGSVMLDLSPMILIIGLWVSAGLVGMIFFR